MLTKPHQFGFNMPMLYWVTNFSIGLRLSSPTSNFVGVFFVLRGAKSEIFYIFVPT